MCASGCACPYAVTSAVTKETPWGGEEVPKGVRHGEERHVVHSLSLEKSLPEIHRLIKSPSSFCDMSSSPLGATVRWTLPLRKRGESLHNGVLSTASFSPAGGFAFTLFPFPNTKDKTKLMLQNKHLKRKKKKKKAFNKKKKLFAGLDTLF